MTDAEATTEATEYMEAFIRNWDGNMVISDSAVEVTEVTTDEANEAIEATKADDETVLIRDCRTSEIVKPFKLMAILDAEVTKEVTGANIEAEV